MGHDGLGPTSTTRSTCRAASIATIPGAETESGTPLGNITTLFGTSALGDFSNPSPCAQFAKPVVYPLHQNVRGALHHIDPNATASSPPKSGCPTSRATSVAGSIVRVVWNVAGEPSESYSWGITLNSRGGANVVNKLNFDMAAIPIDPGSPAQMGWVPGASPFPGISEPQDRSARVRQPDVVLHQERQARGVRDGAHELHGSMDVEQDRRHRARLLRHGQESRPSKTLIGSTAASSAQRQPDWNTSGLPHDAEYYVYVEFDDGTNVNGTYGKWPVRIDHSGASTARLVLNRPVLNFGIAAGTIKTPQQLLRLSVVNATPGQPCWTATSDLSFLTVTPSSGCGAATLTVSLVNQSYHGSGDFTGYLRVSSSGAINSPQYMQTVVRVSGVDDSAELARSIRLRTAPP